MANEQESSKQTSTSSSGNKTLVIVLIIVFAVILLGVGGYFGWKYYKSKITSQASTKTSPSPVVTVTVTASVFPTASPTSTPTLSSSKAIQGDYVISDSDTRIISGSELVNLTPWQLKVARNEIYARHGRPFVHKDLQCYFATKSWYHGNPNYSDSLLTTIDNKNVATILAYEESINSPLLQKDTGC